MTMNSIRTKLYTAIVVLFGSAAANGAWTSAAQASEPPPPSKTVKFADLNIQTPAGAKVLYQRIRFAANQVCEPAYQDPVLKEATPTCVATAIDNAVRAVNAPYLTALRFGNSNVRLASSK
jgi:UrcA family protein